jgi:hypothetical protein
LRVGPSPIPWTQHEPQNMFRDPAKVADPFQTDTPSHTTTDLTSHEIIMTTNPIPIHRDRLLSSKGANRSPEIRKVRKKTSTTLQKKLDAIWTSEAPGTGGVRFGPISTTPPGSKTQPRRRFRAPHAVQNRMCGGSYDQNGGTGPAQYTPQPFSGFNPGQPHGSMQMGATPGWTHMPTCRMVRTA